MALTLRVLLTHPELYVEFLYILFLFSPCGFGFLWVPRFLSTSEMMLLGGFVFVDLFH